jgi:alkylation response protein AidB-like acyl-CoA dehydrogenase
MNAVDMNLIDVASQLGPMLRERGEEGERERRLPKQALAALTDAGLQRMLLPKSLGGQESDPVTCARVIEEVARFDAAAAWALQSNSGCWWAARLSEEAVQDIYGVNANAIMAAAFHPPNKAIEVPGGYTLTGRAPLASNVHDSEWLMLTGMVMEDGRPRMQGEMPEIIGLVLPTGAAEIIDTWHTLGMRATGSHDITLDDVFVPEAAIAGRRPQGKWHHLFHVITLVALPLVYAVYVGVAEAARDLAVRQAMKKRDDANVPYLVGEMENELGAADMALEAMIAAAAAAQPGPDTTKRVTTARTLCGRAAIATVDKAMEVTGGGSFYRSLGLERLFRDVQGARYHPLQEKVQLRYAGRLALGLDIDG